MSSQIIASINESQNCVKIDVRTLEGFDIDTKSVLVIIGKGVIVSGTPNVFPIEIYGWDTNNATPFEVTFENLGKIVRSSDNQDITFFYPPSVVFGESGKGKPVHFDNQKRYQTFDVQNIKSIPMMTGSNLSCLSSSSMCTPSAHIPPKLKQKEGFNLDKAVTSALSRLYYAINANTAYSLKQCKQSNHV